MKIAECAAPVELARTDYPGVKSLWVLCPACGAGGWGVTENDHWAVRFPGERPFGTPEHLSAPVVAAWQEALDCYSANAYTSCALMCRKLLFHMAVEAGLPEKNEKGRAPRFDECLKHLVAEEIITGKQKERWVDSIRVWGNSATHDLAPIDKSKAYQALQFMHQLLQIVYTFPRSADDPT